MLNHKGIIIGLAAAACLLCGYGRAAETSFKEVTSELDPGGNIYLYCSTQGAIKQTVESYNNIKEMILANKSLNPQDRDRLVSGMRVFEAYMRASGLGEIDALGFSSIMTGKDIYRGRVYLYHRPGQNAGFFWNMFGEGQYEFITLKSMPENTVFAYGFYLSPAKVWEWIKQQSVKSDSPESGRALLELENYATRNGKDLNRILQSFDGEIGVILTASETEKVTIRLDEKTSLTFPEPQIAVFFATKDDTLFNEIKGSGIAVQDKDNPDLLNFSIPAMYEFVRPVFAKEKGRLYFASNRKILKSLSETLATGKGMAATEYFKALSGRVPLQGNAFKFVGKRFSAIVNGIKDQVLAAGSRNYSFDSDFAAIEYFGMLQRTDSGFLCTFNTNIEPGTMMIGGAVMAPSAIAAGMLLPALDSARQRAREVSSTSNLKQIGLGIFMFADDHQDAFPESLDMLCKGEYLPKEVLICPETGKAYFYLGRGLKMSELKTPSLVPIAFQAPAASGKVVVLFADGHVAHEKSSAGNCVELIDSLNTKYKYSKPLYEQLLSEAKKLDGVK